MNNVEENTCEHTWHLLTKIMTSTYDYQGETREPEITGAHFMCDKCGELKTMKIKGVIK
jgi:hypothetical protein